MLRIVGDANIPYLHDAFGALGEVETLPARELTRERCARPIYFLSVPQ